MGLKKLTFSIVIPTYNRPIQLLDCLQALAQLDYPRECFEIIVVDDGSKISPEAVVVSFRKLINIMLLTQPNAGPSSARNTGAMRAKGEFLVFTDDDCLPAPDWLQNLAQRFSVAPDCAICGRKLSAPPYNLYTTVSQIFWDYLYAYYNSNPNHAKLMDSANMALPIDSFHAVGGFNENFFNLQDREFCDWWLYQGYKTIYAPNVLVYHAHRSTFRAFWHQHFNYGRGAYDFHISLNKRGEKRVKLEPFSFYLNLLCYPFVKTSGLQNFLLSSLLVISQIATTIGFFHEWVTTAKKTLEYRSN